MIVPDDQLALAIGKEGMNARLAARLTGWKVDIQSEREFAQAEAEAAFGGGDEARSSPAAAPRSSATASAARTPRCRARSSAACPRTRSSRRSRRRRDGRRPVQAGRADGRSEEPRRGRPRSRQPRGGRRGPGRAGQSGDEPEEASRTTEPDHASRGRPRPVEPRRRRREEASLQRDASPIRTCTGLRTQGAAAELLRFRRGAGRARRRAPGPAAAPTRAAARVLRARRASAGLQPDAERTVRGRSSARPALH